MSRSKTRVQLKGGGYVTVNLSVEEVSDRVDQANGPFVRLIDQGGDGATVPVADIAAIESYTPPRPASF